MNIILWNENEWKKKTERKREENGERERTKWSEKENEFVSQSNFA